MSFKKVARSRTGFLTSLIASPAVILGGSVLAAAAFRAGFSSAGTLLFLISILGLLGRLWGTFVLRHVEVSLTCLKHKMTVGETVPLTYTVQNRKLLPMIWFELCQATPPRDCLKPDATMSLYQLEDMEERSEGTKQLYRRRVLFLLGFRELSWETQWTAQRRGVYPIGKLTLRSGDGFGLTQLNKEFPLSHPGMLVAWPKIVSVNIVLLLRNVWQGQMGKRGYIEDPTVLEGLRDYQVWDSWKQIDWRVVARGEELQVKQFDHITAARFHFVLDAASFCGISEQNTELEETISVLASILLELAQAGVTCGLSLPPSLGGMGITFHTEESEQGLVDQLAAFDETVPLGAFDMTELFLAARAASRLFLITYSMERLSEPSLPARLNGCPVTPLVWEETDSGDGILLRRLKQGGGHG